jgi:hypothetical protein
MRALPGSSVLAFRALPFFMIMLTSLVVLLRYYLTPLAESAKEYKEQICALILGFSTFTIFVYGFVLLKDPIRAVYWIVYGALLLVYGLYRNDKILRYFGAGSLVFVILKIYILDIWQWEMWIRVVALSVLGIALVFASLGYQRLQSRNK